MLDFRETMKESRNRWKNLMNVWKNTFQSWWLKLRSTGIKRTTEWLKSYSDNLLNFVLSMMSGNWMSLMFSMCKIINTEKQSDTMNQLSRRTVITCYHWLPLSLQIFVSAISWLIKMKMLKNWWGNWKGKKRSHNLLTQRSQCIIYA